MSVFFAKIKRIWNENKILIIISLFFTIVFAFANMARDDVESMIVEGGTFADYWRVSAGLYFTWSSRVLVNFILYIFTDHNTILWAVYTGISMFVLLAALKLLFLDQTKNKNAEIFMVCMALFFPYDTLSSAGWISTMTTYFSPIAFGMMSLVPIKKVLNNEKIKWWQHILFMLCLIYGANNEQVMVVILFSYLAALIWYSVINRSCNYILTLYSIAAIASAVFDLTCPGNACRTVSASISSFPAFDHLNFIDKVELGYETGGQWLVFGNNLFFEVVTVVLSYLVIKKYKDSFIRILSVLPVLITIGFGPLKSILSEIFPQIDSLSDFIPYWGLVYAGNRGGLGPFTEFFVMTLCLCIVLIEIFLLCDTWKQLIVSLTLVLAGMASRVAIGFSPTIYISGTRTNAVLAFCMIAVIVYLYSENAAVSAHEAARTNSAKIRIDLISIIKMIALFAMLNLVYVVYNTFR